MGSCYAKKAVDFALAQVGKECGKTNEYSAQLDAVDYFNTKKNGCADSCSIFVNACVYNACIEPTPDEDPEGAKWTAYYMMYEPSRNSAAGCTQAASYFKENDAYYTDTQDFERGDQLFFRRSDGALYHTGIIVGWDEDGLDVVEGNTNGGMVALKHYSYSEPKIDGVGRPRYDGWELETAEPEKPVEDQTPEPPAEQPDEPRKSVDELAREVIAGYWGNGRERADRLTEAGYDYQEVQDRVNEILGVGGSGNSGRSYTVCVRTKLNVRYGAGMDYPIKYQLNNGDQVTVYETDGDWGRIGDDAWVCMDYLE